MAEPTAVKVTLLAAIAAFVGPTAAEHGLVVAAGLMGAFGGLSLRQPPLPGFFRPAGHVFIGGAFALFGAPLGIALVLKLAPAAWALEFDSVLPFVALCIGIWWHPAITRWVPGLVGKRTGETKAP